MAAPTGPEQPPQGGPVPMRGAPQPQGPGWWQAQDGLFYPPAGPPPKKKGGGKGCLIALAIVGGLFFLGIVGSIVLIAVAGDDVADEIQEAADEANGADTGGGDDPNPGDLFPDRADTQEEDQEREIGEAARLSGYTTTVNSAEFVQSVSDFEDAGYVQINVTTENRDDSSQPYNIFDWRLQTPDGQVHDPAIVTVPVLNSGDLVGGGEVTGDVYFEVGDQTGEFFIVYKPDPFDAARGIWSVTV